MKYPTHRASREDSRKKPRWYLKQQQPICEWCKKKKACCIHHIENAYRWSKKKNEEWYQLLALCVECHEYIHNHNNFDMREQEKFIANQIINAIKNATINRTMSKEKKEI